MFQSKLDGFFTPYPIFNTKQVGDAKLFFLKGLIPTHPPSIALEILLLFAFIKNQKIYS